ncbi:HpcH/HpaI aldolase/citrate lyase family protein [Nitrosococcus watsonii]|uniref:ATP/GTP-binding protein n=1 Tax=Nitrosococcus watsoni (strain C-113) TaxID=105559 RepID=D8K7I6_NITWC|nr:HpcH/HpaI aldolase/citrate lyase family protein [Nitrosococcus watsonii]ADJ28863.1 ATP/GTP-binding protein [Nitrosococcus watsonii C-113]
MYPSQFQSTQLTANAYPMQAQIPHYMELGATLYMPATRKDIARILNQQKLTGLRSAVVCTEDSILEQELPPALANLRRVLEQLRPSSMLRFIRPRNPEILSQLMRYPEIRRIDGFVLPKVDEKNLPVYAELAAQIPDLLLMPTLETEVAFSRERLEAFRKVLANVGNPILCLRIGGNDLLRLLGLRRPKHLTIYDTPLRNIINDVILTFRPAGYGLSSPVFEYLNDYATLRREIMLDIAHGLLTKAAIHPSQVPVVERAYRVCEKDMDLAQHALKKGAPAVFKLNSQMVEPATHCAWAERLLLQAELYGVCCERLNSCDCTRNFS